MAKDGKEIKGGSGEGFAVFLEGLAKLCFSLGTAAAVIGLAFLVYTLFAGADADAEIIAKNASIWGQALLFGGLAASFGAAYLFWSEETAGLLILIPGAALVLSQIWAPMMLPQGSDKMAPVVGSMTMAGYVPSAVGLLMIIMEVVSRAKLRVQQGAKAEQLKFGKGVKEERDTRNQFLGKCWQLPYCRKFVRERCPIYHARRTCWKERVGCMCEESVIRNAMEGKVIPSDLVAASKYIPQNNKLTPQQKAERCRQCVIYNEHQKHKYQALVPTAIVLVAGVYIVVRQPVGQGIKTSLMNADATMKQLTFTDKAEVSNAKNSDAVSIDKGVIPFHEIILFVIAFVAVAYAIKFIEYLIFKLKV